MAKAKVKLSEEQKQKNEMILARIEAEKRQLLEDTRSLQKQFRRQMRRKDQGEPVSS